MTLFLLGCLFSTIGLGYIIYGKNTMKPAPFIAGMGLTAYPYFISSIFWMILIGIVLIVAPFFLREWEL